MFSRCLRTVASDRPSRRAIWALVCPAAARRSSSHCRRVSRGRAGAAALRVKVGLVQVGAQQGEQRAVALGEVRPGPAAEDQPHDLPGPGNPAGASGQAQYELVLDPAAMDNVVVHAGAVPLPGRVEVRDLCDAAQVAGAVRVAAGFAGPEIVVPERLRAGFPASVAVARRDVLPQPLLLPGAVEAEERYQIAGDQVRQVTEQGRCQAFGWGSPRSSLTIPARVRRSRSLDVTMAVMAPPSPQISPTLHRPLRPGHTQNVLWHPRRASAHTGPDRPHHGA